MFPVVLVRGCQDKGRILMPPGARSLHIAQRTGGQIHLAVAAPDKEEVRPVWSDRWQELERLKVVVQTGVGLETCKEFNKRIRGDNGVLRQAYTATTAQCFRSDVATLMMLVTRDSQKAALALALTPGSAQMAVGPPPLPTDISATGWLSAPGAEGVAGVAAGNSERQRPVDTALQPP